MSQRSDVTVELVVDWRVLGLVLVCGLLLLAAARVAAQGGGESPNEEGTATVGESTQDQDLSGSASLARGRSFYVTVDNYNGAEVLDACAQGYHMASLWEIFEVSNLTYAYDHPDARTQDDSGTGAVSNWYGWVRTGGEEYANNVEGRANCFAWTNAESGNYGTIARLSADWSQAATAVSPWDSQTWLCSGVAPVWCAEDE